MKAITKCDKCGKTIETDDRAFIEQNESFHKCKGKLKIVKVKWKVYPQNEKELRDMEKNES